MSISSLVRARLEQILTQAERTVSLPDNQSEETIRHWLCLVLAREADTTDLRVMTGLFRGEELAVLKGCSHERLIDPLVRWALTGSIWSEEAEDAAYSIY